MTQDPKTVVQQMFDQVWNKSDLSFVDRVYAQDYVAHISGAPQDIESPEQFKQLVTLYAVLTSDLNIRVDDQIAEGDRVATRWSATLTPTKGLDNAPTDDQEVKVTGISIHRFVDGKIVESWDNWDALTFYQSMGVDVLESVSLSI